MFEFLSSVRLPLVSRAGQAAFKRGTTFLSCCCFMAHAALCLAAPPNVTRHPANQTIFYGDPVKFIVEATGTLPLSYQWLRDGAPVGTATSSAYSIPAVSSNDNGAGFSVRIWNSSGTVTSQVAVLTVDFGLPGPSAIIKVLSFDGLWNYNEAENLDAENWIAPNYDDSTWLQGPG